MWGPEPPTEIALKRRFAKLRNLAKQIQSDGKGSHEVSKTGGLATPKSSPKLSKRQLDSEDDLSVPRRTPKRSTRKDIRYREPEIENEEKWPGEFDLEGHDSEDDEDWTPDGDMEQVKKEEELDERDVNGEILEQGQ